MLLFDKTQPALFLKEFTDTNALADDYTEELFVAGKLLPHHEREVEILLKASKKDILKAYKSKKNLRLTSSHTDYAYNLKSVLAYAKKSEDLNAGKMMLLLGHRHLSVSPDTPLYKEPHFIARFNGIKYLIVRDFKELPTEIEQLSLLEELSVDSFYMETWTLDLAKLQNLKLFHLESHALRKLPEMLKDLPHLEMISLTGQQLVPTRLEIPEWLGELKMLKKLVFTYHPATELPDNVLPSNLEEVTFWYNKNLKALPSSLLQCHRLRRLALCRCDALAALPEGLENLKYMEEITLREMKSLQKLDARFIYGSQVKTLDLEGTPAQIVNKVE